MINYKIRWGGLFIFIFVLASCKQKLAEDIQIAQDVPLRIDLKADTCAIPPLAMNPVNIGVNDDFLFFYNNKTKQLFDFFRLSDCHYLFSAGIVGGGPDDFGRLDRRLLLPDSTGFWVFDLDWNRLKQIVIDGSQLRVGKQIRFRIDQDPVNGFLPLNDSLYCCWSGFGKETEYTLTNIRTDESRSFSPYPKWASTERMGTDPIFLYVKNSVVKPDGSRFASFYGYFKRFRIYDCNGELQHDVQVDVPPVSSYVEEEVNDRTIYYYGYPHTTTNHIYALCKNGRYGDAEAFPEVQIWTWEGKPVAFYRLDVPLTHFAVSEKYGKLYGVDGEHEDRIYVYSLPTTLFANPE